MGEYADDYYRNEVVKKHGFDPGSMYDDGAPNKAAPQCPKCGKLCKSDQGIRDHLRDFHGLPHSPRLPIVNYQRIKDITTPENQNETDTGQAEISLGLGDLLWRLRDIRETLMSSTIDGRHSYGCDEWSVPIVNLDSAIKRIESLIATNSHIGRI